MLACIYAPNWNPDKKAFCDFISDSVDPAIPTLVWGVLTLFLIALWIAEGETPWMVLVRALMLCVLFLMIVV